MIDIFNLDSRRFSTFTEAMYFSKFYASERPIYVKSTVVKELKDYKLKDFVFLFDSTRY